MLRKLKVSTVGRAVACIGALGVWYTAEAQDNSPLSIYGIGNQAPHTNIANRAMGGVSAAYNDFFNINYSNPASYAFFQSFQEINSRKINPGRMLLNIGINAEARTLISPNVKERFTTSNIIFSNVMVGLPLRKNWGMAFGLRPLNSVGYKIGRTELLKDPLTGKIIDSALTLHQGTGGAYIASLGTGVKFKVGKNSYLSAGINGGYLFGKKEYNNIRSVYNDSTLYSRGEIQTKTGFGGLYYDAGIQYQVKVSKKLHLGLGAYGTWNQALKANRTNIKTNVYPGAIEIIDTIAQESIDGKMLLPQSYTAGFLLQKNATEATEGNWLLGVDFTKSNWTQYRWFNQPDTSLTDNWQLKIGGEIRPGYTKSYFSRVAYRVGFFTGPDYIQARGKIPMYGVSFGMGLPLNNYSFQAQSQATIINLSLEYISRGSSSTPLKENLYRMSVGFSLSDLWFYKKRYR